MLNKKIIIAGGGTGGHIFPAIAIAHALKKLDPKVDILFVGALGKMEMEKVPQAGYEIIGLDIAGFNRSSLLKNISLPLKLVKSFLQVRRILFDFKPDAVIGVGGYSSFPVLKYAQRRGIPSFIHESNSFAGKTNMMLAKKAVKIFVASDGMEAFFPADKIMLTGNPVRNALITSKISREEAARFFGLEENKTTILVTGGSLGAKSINEAIDAGISQLIKNNLQVIWQTGKPYAVKAAERAVESSSIWINAFINQMEYAYAAADMVVSRAGAMAIAELAALRKPAILVPYPHAAEDHQTVNAWHLVQKEAALMIKDQEAAEKLVPSVLALAKDENRRQRLSDHISRLALPDADITIAKEILNELKD